jgi:hypothetical protein
MQKKLISLSFLCALLGTTGVAFGMEKESTNPEQQLHLVINHTIQTGDSDDSSEQDSTYIKQKFFYDQDGKVVTPNTNASFTYGNYTLKHNKNKQVLSLKSDVDTTNIKLKDLQLSPEQIEIADIFIKKSMCDEKVTIGGVTFNTQRTTVYVHKNGNLYNLVDIQELSETKQDSEQESARQQIEPLGSELNDKIAAMKKQADRRTPKKQAQDNISAYDLIAVAGGISVLAGMIACLAFPEKATQLFEAFTDRIHQLLQSASTCAFSFQNNPINGIAA